MDDTHTTADSDDDGRPADVGSRLEGETLAEALAAMDPADAPDVAEALAADLAAELEAAGAAPPEPAQLTADFGDPPTAPSQ